MNRKMYETEELMIVVQNKLIEKGLIGPDETIKLIACHDIILDNIPRNHYVIQCSKTERKFFLKLQKKVDNIIHCNEYIQSIYQNGDYVLPYVLVSPFPFHNDMFFITNYIEGKDLEVLDSKLSDVQWKKAAMDIRRQLIQLGKIHTQYYSEQNNFFTDEYPKMFRQKLQTRINHISLIGYDKNKIQSAYNNSLRILNNSTFSEPSLIHMDVKPANIIFNPKTEKAVLIDFEFARFGDLDYGIVQVLLTQFNSFSENYKKKMFPVLTDGLITFCQACEVPKLQVYLWYQTMCNIIYYYNYNTKCPNEMKKIYENMLNILSKE
ncbi:phosphotransferase [Ruminococcus bicirculans (ex Wegman et al. 2014)]|uniref:phosphotransferase n=1 Tax=Ruminococcus bicirculans (ex Wegman et al. 2014) TaxID=1160721 RepID=UPI003FD7F942